MANLGWTWEQAEDQLDLHRLAALNREWDRHPPVHHLVASYLDYKPPTQGGTATNDSAELAQFAASGVVIVGKPRLDTSAWDNRHTQEE